MNLRSIGVLGLLTVMACGTSEGTTDAGADGGTDGGGGGEGGGADGSNPWRSALGFEPSNVPPTTPYEPGPEITVSGTCQLGGGKICGTMVPSQTVGGTTVYTISKLTVPAGAKLQIAGTTPIIVVVAGPASIAGEIEVAPAAGGAAAPKDHTAGGGMGGGGPFDVATKSGAGGGGFCGKGGPGGTTGGPAMNGGNTYGTATLIPLAGGSAGGGSLSNTTTNGAGGGAFQLSARVVDVAMTGVVWAGGIGGRATGGGAGSGGAILLEGETITMAGTVAANGGGGGGNFSSLSIEAGEDGQRSAVAAKGSLDPSQGNVGGDGAAAAVLDGKPGVYTGTSAGGQENGGGGGGGGAGRVRLNTRGGAASVTGTVSPSLGSACATQGAVGG